MTFQFLVPLPVCERQSGGRLEGEGREQKKNKNKEKQVQFQHGGNEQRQWRRLVEVIGCCDGIRAYTVQPAFIIFMT